MHLLPVIFKFTGDHCITAPSPPRLGGSTQHEFSYAGAASRAAQVRLGSADLLSMVLL
jgi:hypothetical protein